MENQKAEIAVLGLLSFLPQAPELRLLKGLNQIDHGFNANH